MIAKPDLQSLPKVRSKAFLPESQLKILDRVAKREVITALREEMQVTKHHPDPPQLKQVDLDENFEHLASSAA